MLICYDVFCHSNKAMVLAKMHIETARAIDDIVEFPRFAEAARKHAGVAEQEEVGQVDEVGQLLFIVKYCDLSKLFKMPHI